MFSFFLSFSQYIFFLLTLNKRTIDRMHKFIEKFNKNKLTEPQKLPADKKMIDLIDDLIKQKLSRLFFLS